VLKEITQQTTRNKDRTSTFYRWTGNVIRTWNLLTKYQLAGREKAEQALGLNRLLDCNTANEIWHEV